MNKKYSLILAILVTILIANTSFLFKSIDNSDLVIVARVIDGDTLQLEDGRMVRLLNINSPEKNSPLHEQSKEFLSRLENKEIILKSSGLDKYKRTLARIYYQDNYTNLQLVSLGLASKFLVSQSELNDFDSAESHAVKNELGIWKHSKFYNCISAKIDEKKELVIIKSDCRAINISSWKIKDESRKIYNFNISLNDRITLHSTKGQDNETDIFWNSKTDVWNNDRDTLYLFDEEDNIVLVHSYGY